MLLLICADMPMTNVVLVSCAVGFKCTLTLSIDTTAYPSSQLRIFPRTVACGVDSATYDFDNSDFRYASRNSDGTFRLSLVNITTSLPEGDYRLCLCRSGCVSNSRALYSEGVAYLVVTPYIPPADAVGTEVKPALSCSHIKIKTPGIDDWSLEQYYNRYYSIKASVYDDTRPILT